MSRTTETNHIAISGCLVRDAVISPQGNMADFRIAHNLTSGGKTLFFNCSMYVYGDKTLPRELLVKGSKVIVEGALFDKKRENCIKVESVTENAVQMTVMSNGFKKASLQRVNRVEFDCEITSNPFFGKSGDVARFYVLHKIDQLNFFAKNCVMFRPDEDEGRLPKALLQKDARVVISGRLSLNTWRNPDGEEEVIVENIRAVEPDPDEIPAAQTAPEEEPEFEIVRF